MDKKDLVAISTIVTSAIQATVPDMIKSAIQETVPGMIKEVVQDLLEQNNHMLKREIRDEIYSANKAMENRLIGKIDNLRSEIASDIGDILDNSVLPQITELQLDMARVKGRLAMA